MDLKLGKFVTFTKSLSRQRGAGIYESSLTDDQKKVLEDGGYIEFTRFKDREHNKKVGFIAGKRTITVAVSLEEIDEGYNPYDGPSLVPTKWDTEQVYVVACDMQRLFRVRKEDLEVVK